MNIKRKVTLAVIPLALAVALTSCGTDSTPAPTATPTATASAPADPTPTGEPIIGETTEPAPEVTTEAPAEPAAPAVGETVAKDAVETLRDSGVNVYVPTGSDTGIVVDPAAPLPEVVVNDIKATGPSTPGQPDQTIAALGATQSKTSAMTREMQKAGLSAFYIQFGGDYDQGGNLVRTLYVVSAYNVPGAREWYQAGNTTMSETKEGALAKSQVLFDANPGVPVFDLTQ